MGFAGLPLPVPGIVDSKGNILLAPNLGWENVDIKTALEHTFKLPVVVINEANAGALGEKQYGVGKPYSAISYISVSIGIGTGQIIDGKLFTGANGFAGEFGHMSIDRHGKQCRCGNQGCWELYSSEKALLEIAAINMNRRSISFEQVLAAAETENQAALDAFATVGHSLGIGLVSMIHSMNPEAIIIGNRFAKLKPYIQIPIEETLAKHLPFLLSKSSQTVVFRARPGGAFTRRISSCNKPVFQPPPHPLNGSLVQATPSLCQKRYTVSCL